jgi:hypothetical protein
MGAKSWLQSSYGNVKSFLGDVDSGVRSARAIYGAVAPLLDQAGIGQYTHGHAAKALEGYADLKARAQAAHDTGEQTLQKVRSAVPQFKF